jgi:DNA-directed RNA polymerase subunit K/omega
MSNRDIWVNRCRKKIESRFSLAQAAVLRWEQLLRGARPRISTENPKWMETPLREIASDAVELDAEEFAVKLAGTPYEPPRPEPEDELDDLLGGVLGDAEGETVKETAAEQAASAPAEGEVAADADAAPAAETAAEEPDQPASAEAAPETETDAAASEDDKKKTETQTGDAA